MPRGKVSKDELEVRYADTARELVRRVRPFDVEQVLSAKYGVDRRTVRTWIRVVKARWRETADTTTVDDDRAQMIAQLEGVLAAAWAHTSVVKDSAGNPVMDQNPASPGYGKPLVRSDPRYSIILHAASQLRALKGTDRPVKQHIQLDGEVNVMPNIEAIPEAAAKALRATLETLAPSGDLRVLAGGLFKGTLGSGSGDKG